MKIGYTRLALLVGAGLLLATGLATGQEKPKATEVEAAAAAQNKPVSVYRMDFVVRELENGKPINSRSYSVSGTTKEGAGVRALSKVPTGHMQESEGLKGTEYQNVGIYIDCAPQESENGVLLMTRFTSLSVVPREPGANPPYEGPVIREMKFDGYWPVTLGKPMVMTTLDDVATNRRYEVEVTVTKVR